MFLEGRELRQVKLPDNCPFRARGLALGRGGSALEVLVVESATAPTVGAVRRVWLDRKASRAAPLVLVVTYGPQAALCGPAGENPPVCTGIEQGQAERICREALEQPDRHAALRYLRGALSAVGTELPGIRNEGLLATHELAKVSRFWGDTWSEANRKASPVLANRDEALLRSLGFNIEPCDQVTSILRAAGSNRRTAVAVLLHQAESPELQAERFGGLSPVSYALAVADRENLSYVLVLQGSRLRLHPVKVGVGVGHRGRTETYIEADANILRDAEAGYLWLLFSAEALVEGGTLQRLLAESQRFAGDLAVRLRERIYNEVVPRLAEGLAEARGLKKPTAQDLAETYEMAMTILFRLLFIAYAEDKDLLPFKWNEAYRRRSLKTLARELLDVARDDTPFDESTTHWEEVQRLFRAVEKGNREWGVPEYDGGLFSSDPGVSRVGGLLAQITLPNEVMGPALRDLLIIPTDEGWGPVDFRSLGVWEFGTVYEGLLESELSVAETDLALDEEGRYRSCRPGEEPVVRKQRVYLHNRSGARKSSGTFFTKEFAVEHLLDRALEPALTDHFARLDRLDDDDAAESFFDFRVADIAMGSGHFLVNAIDHIEHRLTQYLAKRSLPDVRGELARLRASAVEALGDMDEQVEIEDTQLLRRLIARRCIYGVDLNPVAVDLARLSIWIHTFVPGLPLSLLDHNLVVGNSLVGIGTVAEIEEKAQERDLPLFSFDVRRMVGDATEPLKRLARIADRTAAEVARARKAAAEAREAVKPATALCDVITGCRMSRESLPIDLKEWNTLKLEIADSDHHQSARERIENLSPLHFPVTFPEVFLRERSGFDVIVGNPPWEEATVEEHAFWARHEPGLRGLSQRQQERLKAELRKKSPDLVAVHEREVAEAEALRTALVTGPYPGMGTGDPDLYKAFCWRFWNLVSKDGGRIGVVLPRSALSAKGSAEFRIAVLKGAEPVEITTLVNNRQWVFPDVHPQYTIGLASVCRAGESKSVHLRGPYASLERFREGLQKPPSVFATDEVMDWTDTASLPLLPTEESLEVFAQMRRAPRLDLKESGQWRARPHTELHATNAKKLMDLKSRKRPRGFWPVFKGASFDIWEPDTGRYYAWADPEVVVPHLHEKAVRGKRRGNSPFSEFESWPFTKPRALPCHSARIAFRDVARATDSRTLRVALVPPKAFITNKGPYFLWPRGDERDQAFLLGVLSSLPLDWYARRFVETNVNFFIINPFPVPRPSRRDSLWKRTVALAGRLAAADKRYASWAEAVGVDCGPIAPKGKLNRICELDAVVAHLYGLKEKHLVHVFETFHEGWGPGTSAAHPTLGDYDERLRTTLKYYRAWKAKEQGGARSGRT